MRLGPRQSGFAFELALMLRVAANILMSPDGKMPAVRKTTTTRLLSLTRRTFCGGLAATAVLPLTAQREAMAQTYPLREVRMGILEVPRARLYFETHGGGPVMLMVPELVVQHTASTG
jgi:hypothetical protein